jgi:hypothetical protein
MSGKRKLVFSRNKRYTQVRNFWEVNVIVLDWGKFLKEEACAV